MKKLIATILLLLTTNFSHAGLIDLGSTTLDDSTGLEWLDMTLTAGQSYNSVIGGFGGYVTSMGYRYATGAEVFALFTNAGIPDIETTVVGNYTAANVAPAQALIALIGTADLNFMDAIVADTVIPGVRAVAILQGDPNIASATMMYACTMCGSWNENATFPGIGSFLVRSSNTSVPEPGVLGLLSLGLLGLGLSRRRQLRV